ncbi:MAG: glycosyltransferase domain-containing protein [Paracoccaceae bacterium]|jgi:hypothetical protein|nr:glycosyltransferase domain-containing protein [Paracoccaceae bacterium]
MGGVIVYTCDTVGFDWVHKPLAPTPGARFVRFAPAPERGQKPWEHRDLPAVAGELSPRMVSRYPKILPHKVFPEAEITIWIDASVVVMTDLTPLIDEFRRSGAAMALFPHPSGRNVDEEFTAAVKAGRIRDADLAEVQRQRYREAGIAGLPITENSILFRRGGVPELDAVMERWWDEMTTYTERDQPSLPFALAGSDLPVHYWNWHFKDEDCPWFRRMAHRPPDGLRRFVRAAYVLDDHHWQWRVVRKVFDATGSVRRSLGMGPIRRRLMGPMTPPADATPRGATRK